MYEITDKKVTNHQKKNLLMQNTQVLPPRIHVKMKTQENDHTLQHDSSRSSVVLMQL